MPTQSAFFRLTTAGLLVFSLASTAAVFAQGGQNQQTRHHGRIVSISSNSITIRAHHHHNGQAAGTSQSQTKTFQIGANTQIQVAGNSGPMATPAVLNLGEEVAIESFDGMAETITILHQTANSGTAAAAATLLSQPTPAQSQAVNTGAQTGNAAMSGNCLNGQSGTGNSGQSDTVTQTKTANSQKAAGSTAGGHTGNAHSHAGGGGQEHSHNATHSANHLGGQAAAHARH